MSIEEPLVLQNLRTLPNSELLDTLENGQMWFERYCPDIGSPADEEVSLCMSTAIDELRKRLKQKEQ